MVILGQGGCTRAKIGCIRAKWLYCGKVIVAIGQKRLYLGKVVV